MFPQTQAMKTGRQVRQSDFEQKKVRAYGFQAKLKSEVLKQRSEGASYAMDFEINKIINLGKRKK